MSSKYTDEERAAVLAAGRAAIADADAVLDKPRPQAAAWPSVETRADRWRREDAEQEQRLAQERREQTLTETEAARLEHRLVAQIGAGLDQQKELILQVVAGVVAEERAAFDQKIAELSAEIGQLRADLTIAKAFNNKSGEVLDLPALPLRRAS